MQKMKKRPQKHGISLLIALCLIGFAGVFFWAQQNESIIQYECPENIPLFRDVVERSQVEEILGFEHPEILKDWSTHFVGDYAFLNPTLVIDCVEMNRQIYISLLYPSISSGVAWTIQFIHFQGETPIIQTLRHQSMGNMASAFATEVSKENHPHYFPLIQDRNQNGLLDIAASFGQGCSTCLNQDLWFLELKEDGNLYPLTPLQSQGRIGFGVNFLEDINGDGLPEILGIDYLFLGTSSYDKMYYNYVFEWTGSGYTLSYLNVEGVDNPYVLSELLLDTNNPQTICHLILNEVPQFEEYWNSVARNFLRVVFYYEIFFDDYERGWAVINPLLEDARECPSEPAIDAFWEDMIEVGAYLERYSQ